MFMLTCCSDLLNLIDNDSTSFRLCASAIFRLLTYAASATSPLYRHSNDISSVWITNRVINYHNLGDNTIPCVYWSVVLLLGKPSLMSCTLSADWSTFAQLLSSCLLPDKMQHSIKMIHSRTSNLRKKWISALCSVVIIQFHFQVGHLDLKFLALFLHRLYTAWRLNLK